MVNIKSMITYRIQYIVKEVGLSNKIFNFQEEAEDCLISIQNVPESCIYNGKSAKQYGEFLVTAQINRKPARKILQWLNENQTELLTTEFINFTSESETILLNSVFKFLKQIRWLNGYRSSHIPSILFYKFEWCFNNNEWGNIFKITADGGFVTIFGVEKVSDKFIKELRNIREHNFDEPLAHELYQEAWNSKNSGSPRSALVMAIAASETGIKRFITKLAPDTEWLLQNLPTPPLVDLLEKYLPLLASNISLMQPPLQPIPESLKLILKKGINLRNAIVHGKNIELKSKTIDEIFGAINDLLYVLDYYEGHIWAIDYVDNKTRKEWLRL